MAGDWIQTTLGEVLTLQRGFDLPESERRPGPYPVIASTGPVGAHDQAMVEGSGVVIGRSGSLGGGQFINGDFWPLNTTLWVKDFKGNDRRFCYYLLKSLDLAKFNAGSGVPTLNRNHIHPLRVTIPKQPGEQRAIAHILGTLDDKIELNRRMNATLEAMGRALYKDWFVDFGPVRAKMEGREPYLSREMWDLFSDRLVESELGEIPEGWRVGAIGDVADHPRRGVQPQDIDPESAYIALEHMPRRCLALYDWGIAGGIESNKFRFNRGEILFGKLRPYFHKVGIAPLDGVCSTDIVVVKPKSDEWFEFVLSHVSSDSFVEYTNAGATGTKMPRTNWTDMARYKIAIPAEAVARSFGAMLNGSIDQIVAGIHESRSLSLLRDTLLPKLISSDLRVPDTMLQIEEAIA